MHFWRDRTKEADFLFHRGGTEGVPGGEHDTVALSLEAASKLADGGGLSGTIDPDHQDHLGSSRLGRGHRGRGWGGAESPDCSGFTVAQLQSLDFSRMNLAEFYAEIAPTLPDVGTLRSRAQQKINGYFGP